jgi:hypothetical protein
VRLRHDFSPPSLNDYNCFLWIAREGQRLRLRESFDSLVALFRGALGEWPGINSDAVRRSHRGSAGGSNRHATFRDQNRPQGPREE